MRTTPLSFDIPSSWAVARGESLFPFVTSGSRGWAEFYSEKGPLFLRIGNLDHGTISLDLSEIQRVQPPAGTEGTRTQTRSGDILISITADVGMVGIVPASLGEAYINQHIALARPVDALNPRYIAWFLASPIGKARLRSMERGATKKGLGLDDIRAVTIPIAPRPEQDRIVAEVEKQLTRLDAGFDALKRVQSQLKRYRASVLKTACEGQLVATEAELARREGRTYESAEHMLERVLRARRSRWEEDQLARLKATGKLPKNNQWKAKYVEPSPSDKEELPPLPEGWIWASLGQVTAESLIGVDCGAAQQSLAPPGLPYIKMNNVSLDGRVDMTSLAYIPASRVHDARFGIRDGDLLFNTRNSKELVGKVGIVRNPPASATFNNNLMRLRFDGAILPAFACLQMCSIGFRTRMELVKKATTSVAAVYAKDLFLLPIAVPPIAEQARIVAEVEQRTSVLDLAERALSVNLRRAALLRSSVLQRAFEGRLVQQNPRDESASLLLERIASMAPERSASRKMPKGKLKLS